MNGAAWLLALATMGVDYGWQLDEKGKLEYIIQLSPADLESLRTNPEGLRSSLPPEVVGRVRRFRIVVGTDPLPKDQLPAFSPEGQPLGAVTPINVGAARVTPAIGPFPNENGDMSGNLDSPVLESTVTPLGEGSVSRDALPGPSAEIPGPPPQVNDFLPLPAFPRGGMEQQRPPEMNSMATMMPGAVIRRDLIDNARPNVSAPDAREAWGSRSASFGNLPSYDTSRNSYNGFAQNGDPFREKFAPLVFTVCALCLSIGGNIFLGWTAWGYYMKYRESFESWRNAR